MTSKISEMTPLSIANGAERVEVSQNQLGSPETFSSFSAALTPVHMLCNIGDEATAIDSSPVNYGTIFTFRAPFPFHFTSLKASLTSAHSSGTFTIDVNKNGASLLSTPLTIDAGEKTSATAATPAVIDTASSPRVDLIADDDEITIDVDDVADGTAAGLKIWLIGYRI